MKSGKQKRWALSGGKLRTVRSCVRLVSSKRAPRRILAEKRSETSGVDKSVLMCYSGIYLVVA